jgi:hypothetical protein
MDLIDKELASRYNEIKAEIKAIYSANEHITGWDIPEVDENEASLKILELMQKALDEVKEEVLGSKK